MLVKKQMNENEEFCTARRKEKGIAIFWIMLCAGPLLTTLLALYRNFGMISNIDFANLEFSSKILLFLQDVPLEYIFVIFIILDLTLILKLDYTRFSIADAISWNFMWLCYFLVDKAILDILIPKLEYFYAENYLWYYKAETILVSPLFWYGVCVICFVLVRNYMENISKKIFVIALIIFIVFSGVMFLVAPTLLTLIVPIGSFEYVRSMLCINVGTAWIRYSMLLIMAISIALKRVKVWKVLLAILLFSVTKWIFSLCAISSPFYMGIFALADTASFILLGMVIIFSQVTLRVDDEKIRESN